MPSSCCCGRSELPDRAFHSAKGSPTLADLSRFALDVGELQVACELTYTEWHTARLHRVLEWLASLVPIPHLIVFPECSIPIHDLHLLRIRRGTWVEHVENGSRLSAPRYCQFFQAITLFAHVKSVPSVFEQTDLTRTSNELPTLNPIALEINGTKLSVMPAVCAEAIQLNSPGEKYDLVVIVAYNDGIAPFLPTIQQNVQNGVPVIFCNDGRMALRLST